jgi:DNA-binding transcriptional regulator YiaG
MSVRFRNVDVDTSRPADDWPAEALEIVLDRGALGDWRHLSTAIRANPWGPAARAIEQAAASADHYGIDQVMLDLIRDARAQVDRSARQRYAKRIKSLRRRTGLSQREFARLVGTSASRLSDYENGKVAPTTDVLGRIEDIARRRIA